MQNQFVVIDGSALMCVAYYGSLPEEVKNAKTDEEKERSYQYLKQSSKGIYTNGIQSFLNTLLNIIEQQKPSHLAICFDESRETTFRKEIYPNYKAQRSDSPEPLQKQMQNIRTLLKACNISILLSPTYEADDYAGSLCKTFERIIPMRFVTKDRDYLQLISPYTKGWMMTNSETKWLELCDKYGIPQEGTVPYGFYEYDKKIVKGEFGIIPSQITDWKGISGDSSDNLPGIKGVSDKTTIPLLNHYGSLENIYQAIIDAEAMGILEPLKDFWKNTLGITRPPIKLIKENIESGLLCKQLATIKTNLDVGNLEDYKTNIDFERMKVLLHKLELNDVYNRVNAYLDSLQSELEEEYELDE